jgi:hypothetical protein
LPIEYFKVKQAFKERIAREIASLSKILEAREHEEKGVTQV